MAVSWAATSSRSESDAARKNVRGGAKPTAGDTSQPDIRQWDARHLPLDDASVDKIATNPPFGKQLRGSQTPAKLYPPILAELQRVVRPRASCC
jgi:23S rRNA G2445 N2-methylase RlmL